MSQIGFTLTNQQPRPLLSQRHKSSKEQLGFAAEHEARKVMKFNRTSTRLTHCWATPSVMQPESLTWLSWDRIGMVPVV